MRTANLPPGEYGYDVILEMISRGDYICAYATTASGRRYPLIGFSDEQVSAIVEKLTQFGLVAIISGSRVVGPRVEQRKLHTALSYLQLVSSRRAASATYPELNAVKIQKTLIKEFGLSSIHTSDLSVLLVDRHKRAVNQREELAVLLERYFKTLGCNFPIRVFAQLGKQVFDDEDCYVAFGIENFILPTLPQGLHFENSVLRAAFRKTYAKLGDHEPA